MFHLAPPLCFLMAMGGFCLYKYDGNCQMKFGIRESFLQIIKDEIWNIIFVLVTISHTFTYGISQGVGDKRGL